MPKLLPIEEEDKYQPFWGSPLEPQMWFNFFISKQKTKLRHKSYSTNKINMKNPILKLIAVLALLAIQFSAFSQDKNVQMVPYIDNSGRDIVLTWNTISGESVFYAWNTSINGWKAYSINLPAKPLAGAEGDIMMEPYIDNSGRDVCLVWDTKTGKSVFYAWNTSINGWKAYSINLPASPITATGKIMMRPYIDNSGRDVCLVWDTATGKSVFYAWNTSINNWKAYSINLPESPVK